MSLNAAIIDKYWRVANYLTVAFMYLQKNFCLQSDLEQDDLKKYAIGHWGTSIGINFIIAHLNSFVRNSNQSVQLVVGPGHAGNALLVNLLLEGTLETYYPDLSVNKLNTLQINSINQFFAKTRTEINPFYSGMIYDGGELGYSLPVAFGAVLDKPDLISICIIGDGEFETGTISSSWQCKEYVNRSSGFVLPILHLNGYRMGNRSLLSYKTDDEISQYFQSMGYKSRMLNFDHEEMIKALNWANQMYAEIRAGVHNIWPVLVLQSSKVNSGPKNSNFPIENPLSAHKDPLRNFSAADKTKYLQYWLTSYGVHSLLEEAGGLQKLLSDILPPDHLKIGRATSLYKLQKIVLPDIEEYALESSSLTPLYSNTAVLVDYLSDVIIRNSSSFRIVSPDELQSNFPVYPNPLLRDGNTVMEILNENICQAWMQGYIMTGRNAIFVSYEAFIPIITSMISQLSKWLYQTQKIEWRMDISSFTYLLTSLCEENTYSHQNPEFVNSILANQFNFVRVYMPIDTNTLLASIDDCLSSINRINAIVASKRKLPQYLVMDDAVQAVKQGYAEWNFIENNRTTIDFVIAVAGDHCTREGFEAYNLLHQYNLQLNIRIVSVIELTTIGDMQVYPHALADDDFNTLFANECPIVFCFHGYKSAIHSLLYKRVDPKRLTVLGYCNKSITSTNALNKMILNGNSRYHIILEMCNMLKNRINPCLKKQIKHDMIYHMDALANGEQI